MWFLLLLSCAGADIGVCVCECIHQNKREILGREVTSNENCNFETCPITCPPVLPQLHRHEYMLLTAPIEGVYTNNETILQLILEKASIRMEDPTTAQKFIGRFTLRSLGIYMGHLFDLKDASTKREYDLVSLEDKIILYPRDSKLKLEFVRIPTQPVQEYLLIFWSFGVCCLLIWGLGLNP